MKVWGITEDRKYRFESLTDETLEAALNIYRESFLIDEAVCIGAELEKSPQGQEELVLLSIDAAQDGVSLVAVTNDDSRQVAAICFNKLQVQTEPGEKAYFERFQSEICKDAASRSLINFMLNVDSRTDLFKLYNVDCIFEIMFLATAKDHRGRRLGTLLSEYSYLLAEDLKNQAKPIKKFKPVSPKYKNIQQFIKTPMMKNPGLCSSILTSNISQKIGNRLNFEKVVDVSYEEFVYKGKTYASRIGPESPYTTLVAKRIN